MRKKLSWATFGHLLAKKNKHADLTGAEVHGCTHVYQFTSTTRQNKKEVSFGKAPWLRLGPGLALAETDWLAAEGETQNWTGTVNV